MVKIHFVCRANVWRSRVAEAYAKSLAKNKSDLQISSSGIEATRDWDGPVASYTKRLLEQDNLWRYAKPAWTQTTQEFLDASDVVVFMNRAIYEDAQQKFQVSTAKSLVWDIRHACSAYETIKSNTAAFMQQYL